jgi:ubiquinone/menaquinone biosynthesis C-methylase UbiE
MEPITRKQQLKKMEADWDKRAKENARFYVASERDDWTDEDFFRSGRRTVEEEVLTDMGNICQGRDPKQMKVLEIGCGAGRVTSALADVFGEVHAVDVSKRMVKLARRALAGKRNAHVYKNNGMDLSALPEIEFDFAFSTIVFQHIPSLEIIENYIREVNRLLRPGSLFKFQVQGSPQVEATPDDTWVGVPITDDMAVEMANRCGFEPRYRHGVGEQYFWLWFFKKA